MARQEVIQVRCDRCKRTELQLANPTAKTDPDFRAKFGGIELKYDDLCTHCRETVQRVWTELSEWRRELTQTFLGPTVSNNQAAPIVSAPDYSPPKPHSGAGLKR